LKVTDLSSQLWCEKEVELSLIYGKEVTEEAEIGREIHDDLHRQVADLVEVQSYTINDSIAIKFHNLSADITRLLQEGMTREIPVFGRIESLYVRGIIDELRLQKDILSLIDHKTRKSFRMPGDAQIRINEFQLMVYYKLLDDSISGKFDSSDLLSHYYITESDTISEAFQRDLDKDGLTIEPNIQKLVQYAFMILQKLPNPSEMLQCRYEFQKNRKIIGIHNFNFNKQGFERDVNFLVSYWLGEREAKPVGLKNRWKCRYCTLSNKCDVINVL
jgi:exonuclease V